jgi:hypothetical protein
MCGRVVNKVAPREKGGPIQAMHGAVHKVGGEDKQLLVTGDKAGTVAIWELGSGEPRGGGGTGDKQGGEDWSLSNIFSCSLAADSMGPQRPLDPSVRSVWLDKGQLLVGTAGAEVLETKVRAEQAGALDWRCVCRAHYSGELWGLDVHPTHRLFATGEALTYS